MQVLNNIDQYETSVDTEVLTQHPQYLTKVLPSWRLQHSVVAVGPATESYTTDSSPFRLIWEHRFYMRHAFNSGKFPLSVEPHAPWGLLKHHSPGKYSTYMYLEDDTLVPWPALVSWAFDTEVLEPLGFMRGFYRTEVSPMTGELVLLDIRGHVVESQWKRSIQVAPSPLVCNTTAGEWNSTQPTVTSSPRTCLIHSTYIELPWCYMGMWISTHLQLQKFIQSNLWEKEKALALESLYGIEAVRWFGYPERSTVFQQFVEVPTGHETANVIPYDPVAKQLATNAAVAHLRNAYFNFSGHSSIPVAEFFSTSGPLIDEPYIPTLISTRVSMRTAAD
jgi:hypothetical protein